LFTFQIPQVLYDPKAALVLEIKRLTVLILLRHPQHGHFAALDFNLIGVEGIESV
jgi:hypothetical protein